MKFLIFVVLLIFILGLDAYAELIAHWPMDEGSGKKIDDIVGKGGVGTFVGNPRWVEGKFGKALEFGTGNSVSVPSNPDLQPTSVTVTLWVYFNEVAPPRQDFFSKNDDYALSLHEWANDGTIFPIIKTPGGWVVKAGTLKVKPEQWYHVALVYNEKTKELLSYIDGKEDAKISAPGGIEHRGGLLTLGTYADRFLKGKLDEVKIWNEPLSKEKIEADMKGPLAVSSIGKAATLWSQIRSCK